ncbi:MAG TPA: TetR/AcrR family transcriptional regulator [Candidatus Saccharimonadales bacterium]|nr:TetR/AcrR family transcriptional regulator [Candidatus Saccharimonadales bacterium]
MYDPDKFRNKAARRQPSQARGKERVRVILAAALALFKESGVAEVTTNDIAERARIPIGSLYRYYPNKDTIIIALTELVVDDLSQIFTDIGNHPLLEHLSWDEVLLLLADAWVNYVRLNGPFEFLYSAKANPRLGALSRPIWVRFVASFTAVLQKRCPEITARELAVCFNLTLAAVEMDVTGHYRELPGTPIHHEAVGAIASYMLAACKRHQHSRPSPPAKKA